MLLQWVGQYLVIGGVQLLWSEVIVLSSSCGVQQ